jgi:hypothetical protein
MGDFGGPRLFVDLQVNMHAQSLPLGEIESLRTPKAYQTISMNNVHGYCISVGESDALMGLLVHVQQRGMDDSERANDMQDVVHVGELHLTSGRSPGSR